MGRHLSLVGGANFVFALLLAVLALPAHGNLQAQISPGPLSKAHESLSGVGQCTSCHRFATAGGGLKCLDCHTEINQRLTANQGFHAAVVKRDNPNKDCVRCHSEHNGKDFQLIRWEPSQKAFDHKKTGYALEGKHATVECRQCHSASHVDPQTRTLIKEKNLDRTFLGLSTACLSCHKDFHRGQLSKNCQNCHNTPNWKDVSLFNHVDTRYPLTGLHANVACVKCHQPAEPGGPPKYTGLKFSTCSACH